MSSRAQSVQSLAPELADVAERFGIPEQPHFTPKQIEDLGVLGRHSCVYSLISVGRLPALKRPGNGKRPRYLVSRLDLLKVLAESMTAPAQG